MSTPVPPLVAAIVPTRDRPELLARAARSALAQTYPSMEVRVIDDGSERPAALPSDVAADPRVRLIRLPRSVGAAAARNEGVAHSTAPFVAFLDDDDAWHPGKVAREMLTLGSAPESVAAVASGYETWARGRRVVRNVPDPRSDLRLELLAGPTLAPSTVMMRRSAFDQLGGFDPRLTRVEDWDLWLRLVDRFDVVRIPEVLAIRSGETNLAPEEALRYERTMTKRLEPRIALLDAPDQRWVRARHAFRQGVLLISIGERMAAARLLWRAWMLDPRWLRPGAHLAHAAVGDRVWNQGRRLLRPSRG